MATNSAPIRIYDQKIEDGGQVIAVETVLIESTFGWEMHGESALVNKGFGFTFWTDREGHDILQEAFEKVYGKSCCP